MTDSLCYSCVDVCLGWWDTSSVVAELVHFFKGPSFSMDKSPKLADKQNIQTIRILYQDTGIKFRIENYIIVLIKKKDEGKRETTERIEQSNRNKIRFGFFV